MTGLTLFLASRGHLGCERERAVMAVIREAYGWTDPTTGDLFDPLGLSRLALDLLTGRVTAGEVTF